MRRRLAAGIALGALVVIAPAFVWAVSATRDRFGPKGLLPNGRALHPYGVQVDLRGNFTHGAALTPDGRFLWTVQAGEGHDDIRIVSLAARRVVQVLPLPGASGGIAIAPDGRRAYVAGEPDAGERPGGDVPAGFPGRNGDVIHVFAVDRSKGRATDAGVIGLPPPAGTAPPQDFPPTRTAARSWPQEVAISPDGKTLLVALSLADRAAVVDLRTRAVRYLQTGSYPYGAAILPGSRTGLISNEGPGTVSIIDLASASKLADVQAGAPLSHPQGIAVARNGKLAYVALANADAVAVIDTASRSLQRTISLAHSAGDGASPITASVTASNLLLVPEANADDVAVVALPGAGSAAGHSRAFTLVGRVPTADYSVAALATPEGALACGQGTRRLERLAKPLPRTRAAVSNGKHSLRHRTPNCAKLVWVAAKGIGLGPNTTPVDPRYSDNAERQTGRVGIADLPSAATLAKLAPKAESQLRPTNFPSAPPSDTPLRGGGPIKHVFFIVRENRNYDQVLGDLGRGDGDPALAIFGRRLTPNMHALANRFGVLDRAFADAEVSIDGHFWTSAAQTSDFVQRNNHPSNAGRDYPYDFVYSISWPQHGFLFDRADAQGISWFNFGEGIAGVLPIPDKDRSAAQTSVVTGNFGRSDLGAPTPGGCYPSDAYIGTNPLTGNMTFDSAVPPGAPLRAESRFSCFATKFGLQLATNTVPALTYMVNVDDHTQGTRPGQRTPQAMMATSDWGLGQIVSEITHSKVWPQSAIFVVEDDAQEGLDHVDAHRMVAFAISPWSPRGAIVSTRYDQLSVIRSIELLLGLRPLGLADALATPMYGAFTAHPGNLEPYDAIVPGVSLTALNTASSPDAALSQRLNFSQPDRVSPQVLERILWDAAHGKRARLPSFAPAAGR